MLTTSGADDYIFQAVAIEIGDRRLVVDRSRRGFMLSNRTKFRAITQVLRNVEVVRAYEGFSNVVAPVSRQRSS